MGSVGLPWSISLGDIYEPAQKGVLFWRHIEPNSGERTLAYVVGTSPEIQNEVYSKKIVDRTKYYGIELRELKEYLWRLDDSSAPLENTPQPVGEQPMNLPDFFAQSYQNMPDEWYNLLDAFKAGNNMDIQRKTVQSVLLADKYPEIIYSLGAILQDPEHELYNVQYNQTVVDTLNAESNTLQRLGVNQIQIELYESVAQQILNYIN
jgi:hypothetical protein